MTGFDDAMMLIALISDPAAYKARLTELRSMIAAADERTAEAQVEQDKLAARVAELDQREADIREKEVEVYTKGLQLAERDRTFGKLSSDLMTREKQLKIRMMQNAGLFHNFNERMMSWPSFEDIEAELEPPKDGQYDDGSVVGTIAREREFKPSKVSRSRPSHRVRPGLTLTREAEH